MKLGDIIKENRMGLGMTMDELANKSGLSKGYISMLEKGENPKMVGFGGGWSGKSGKSVENNCGGVKTTRQNCIKTPPLKSPI